jgi:hypothetical protein
MDKAVFEKIEKTSAFPMIDLSPEQGFGLLRGDQLCGIDSRGDVSEAISLRLGRHGRKGEPRV